MDGYFEIKIHPDFIHLTYPPGATISPESEMKAWTAIAALCAEHGTTNFLIEADAPGREMDTMSAFDSGRALAESAVGLTIAFCFHDYEFDDLTAFFKTVAQNRGVKLEFFNETDEALKWLGVKAGKQAHGQH